jgi:hypothetical protein
VCDIITVKGRFLKDRYIWLNAETNAKDLVELLVQPVLLVRGVLKVIKASKGLREFLV